jgi:thiamine transport system substrate-binding protein
MMPTTGRNGLEITRAGRLVAAGLVIVLAAASCGDGDEPAEATTTTTATSTTTSEAPAPIESIVLMTHDSFAVSEEVLAEFEAQTGVAVEVLLAGDAGAMVGQAILTKDNPLADVIYGVDNTFLSRALDAEIFIPYRTAGAAEVAADLLVPGDPVTPIDFGDVCLNYDIAGLADAGLPTPANLEELTDPAYSGTLVVQNPASSSPGLAFLLATIAAFPEGSAYDWKAYWTDLVANDVLVSDGWETAYYGEFSGGTGEGTRPIVVSYASSPPAEVFFGELDEAPTGVVADGCFRQVEYAGILTGTEAEGAAQELIDFMVSPRFQEDMPLNMFVFPANRTASIPEVFLANTVIPANPTTMDPETIEMNRERWIDAWTEIVR